MKQDNPMNLNEIIDEIKKLSIAEQIEFCNQLSQNIFIGIRSILSYKNETELDRLEGIKWLNEFQHRINNLKIDIERNIGLYNKIDKIEDEAIFYASKSNLTKGEIAGLIRTSYEKVYVRNKKEDDSIKLKESIFDLIVDKSFREKTAMYIGERKISVLNGFMNGYFYGTGEKIFHIQETEPKFEKFTDWIANYYNWTESTAGWKNIILVECHGDENSAIDTFFRLYDKYKLNKDKE